MYHRVKKLMYTVRLRPRRSALRQKLGRSAVMLANKRQKWLERSHRADRNFALASIALIIFFLVAGFSAWMSGNSGAPVVEQAVAQPNAR